MGTILNIKSLNYKRIIYHVIFWTVIVLLYDIIQALIFKINFTSFLLLDIFYTPADLLLVYFTLYVLFPKFLYKKKYFLFLISFITFFSILMLIAFPLQHLGVTGILKEELYEMGEKMPDFKEFIKKNLLIAITLKLMILGIASAIKLSKIWIISQKKQQELEKDKLEIDIKLKESELQFLKSQINPHFLFNALNNLYSLTLAKSKDAPDTVLKISALLDYMLYDCNVSYIDLEKEINSLLHYIDLQKIRYGDTANINVNIEGDISQTQIAPLIFLPFVENAFEHGLINNMGKGDVNIEIKIDEGHIDFNIDNTYTAEGEKFSTNSGKSLKNIKTRLDLQYKDKHTLEISRTENIFTVKLNLILNETLPSI